MRRFGEVALLFTLFVLLGSMHGIRAQYDEYDYEDYDEAGSYDYEEDKDTVEDYQEGDADASTGPEEPGEGGWSTDSRLHSDVQQRELLDQGGLGAVVADVLHLGVQGWIQKTH